MGSSFDSRTFEDKGREQLRRDFGKLQRELRIETGTSYSGNLGMCSGLSIHDNEFVTKREAEDYLIKNTEKWGMAIAVKVNGKWIVGGWCSS